MSDNQEKTRAGAAPRITGAEREAWIRVYEYQRRRLERTYADFRDAGADLHRFFFEFVYLHPAHRPRFEKRDQAFVRIARNWLFRRLTTRELHAYLEGVIRLQALTDALDVSAARHLARAGVSLNGDTIPDADYAAAYRAAASRAQRIAQVELVLKTFELCNRIVNELPLNLDQILRYTPKVFLRDGELLNLCIEAYHTFHRHGGRLDEYDAALRERELAYIHSMFGGEASHV